MHLDPSEHFAFPSAPIAFVDLETTGGTFGVDRITEIGIVEVGPSGVSQWTSLVNPQKPMDRVSQGSRQPAERQRRERHTSTYRSIDYAIVTKRFNYGCRTVGE